jgi:hypothetical protein
MLIVFSFKGRWRFALHGRIWSARFSGAGFT